MNKKYITQTCSDEAIPCIEHVYKPKLTGFGHIVANGRFIILINCSIRDKNIVENGRIKRTTRCKKRAIRYN